MESRERDTIPCPGADVMCEHCGGTAVALYGLNVFEPNQCAQCGHPGRLERDSTGALYWALLTGKCDESHCVNCHPVTEDSGLFVASTLPAVTVPTVAQLVGQAQLDAVARKCPPGAALRSLVDDYLRQISSAQTTLIEAASQAAQLVAQKEVG